MTQEVYEMLKLERAETVYDCPECGAGFKNDPEVVHCTTCNLAICASCPQSRCEGCGEPICEHHTKTLGDLDYCPGCHREALLLNELDDIIMADVDRVIEAAEREGRTLEVYRG